MYCKNIFICMGDILAMFANTPQWLIFIIGDLGNKVPVVIKELIAETVSISYLRKPIISTDSEAM